MTQQTDDVLEKETTTSEDTTSTEKKTSKKTKPKTNTDTNTETIVDAEVIAETPATPTDETETASASDNTATQETQTEETVSATEETTENTSQEEKSGKEDDLSAIKSRNWSCILTRAVFMIAFGALSSLAMSVAFSLAFINMLVLIVTGEANTQLTSLTQNLGKYVAEVFDYLSQNTEEKPFPLGRPFPSKDE